MDARSVGPLFSNTTVFRLPWFQRTFCWRTREIARLVGDLLDAMSRADPDDDFQLGTLMAAGGPDLDGLSIVDGHQRIMTLTILFAVLRDLEPEGPVRTELQSFIADTAGPSARFRLVPQPHVAKFFQQHIQDDGGTLVEPDAPQDEFSDCLQRILEVREYLRSRLGPGRETEDTRHRLVRFLADRCRVVLQVFDDEATAWRVFSIEETTRVAFDPAAQAKTIMLAVMPEPDRAAAATAWEGCELRLGATGLADLLRHLRTLKLRKRSDNPVEKDLCQQFGLDRNGMAFVDGWLKPHADTLEALRAAARGQGRLSGPLSAPLARLGWIDDQIWIPAALRWLETRRPNDPSALRFFTLLERRVWLMRIAGVDPTQQRTQIIRIVDEMDRVALPDNMGSLALDDKLVREAIDNLRAQNFFLKGHALAVLRRVSLAFGQDPGPFDKATVTIEHILPRNPPPNRQWWAAFRTQQAVKENMHRLGNLTFLTADENQQAETKDWVDKRPILARSRFVMSQAAAEAPEWNRKTILARSEDLIRRLMAEWEVTV